MLRFDPDTINEIAQRHVNTRPFERMFEDVGADLKAVYGDDIDTTQPLFLNSSGGIMYQIKLFAMTPEEYVMICGSSIPSTGYSGRHPVAFWDTVLSGEARYMHEDMLEPRHYCAGDRIFVDKGQAATIGFPDHCWMLEYARGFIPAIIPFGMVSTLFTTLDFKSGTRGLQVYGSLTKGYLNRNPQAAQKFALGALAAVAGLWMLRSARK